MSQSLRPPALAFHDVSFSYAGSAQGAAPVLSHVSFEVEQGAFALVVGATGSGKSTLLRLAKPELAPQGELSGEVEACGEAAGGLSAVASARSVGLVFQNPEAQIVCDTVWHELAFGLENLGTEPAQMRRRVAEACNFLGMGPWFGAHTAELSCGQRQLVALASVLVMRPRVLLLDEPTSMLDPVAAKGFLSLLFRANRELGITVVVATHDAPAMVPYATCAYMLTGEGSVRPCALAELAEQPSLVRLVEEAAAAGEPVAADAPHAAGEPGAAAGEPVAAGASHAADEPGASHVAAAVPRVEADEPATAGAQAPLRTNATEVGEAPELLCASGLWQRYARERPWVLRELSLSLAEGEIRALVGGNGSGKTTLLSALAGALRTQRGRVRNAAAASQALLPQNPKSVLTCQSVREELMAWSAGSGAYGEREVAQALERLGLADAPERHPYDLSGGQQQLLALEKLLLVRPRLLLLDEPTKGLDVRERARVARRLLAAAREGATIVLISHDLPFIEAVADRVSLLFDGQIACTQPTRDYLADAWMV